MPVKKKSRRRGNEVWVENPKVKGGGYWRKFKPGKDQPLVNQNQARITQSPKSTKSKSPSLVAGAGIVASLTALGISAAVAGGAVKAVSEMRKRDQAFLGQSAIANTNPEARETVVNSLLGKAGIDPKDKNTAANIAKSGLIAGAVTAFLPPAAYGAAVLNYRSNFDNNVKEVEAQRAKIREDFQKINLSQGIGDTYGLSANGTILKITDKSLSGENNKQSKAITFLVPGFAGNKENDPHKIAGGASLYGNLRYKTDKKGRVNKGEVDERFTNQQFFVMNNAKSNHQSGIIDNFVNGKNSSAIELAASVAAYRDVFPDRPINILAESGGGFAAAEAAEYLDLMGVKDLKFANLGTPYYGVTKEAKSSKQITFNTPFDHITSGQPVRNEININEVKDHNKYLKSNKTKAVLSDFFNGKDVSGASESAAEISETDRRLKMKQYRITYHLPQKKKLEERRNEIIDNLLKSGDTSHLVNLAVNSYLEASNNYGAFSADALNWYIETMQDKGWAKAKPNKSKKNKTELKTDSGDNSYRTDKKSRRQGNKVWVKDPSVSGGGYWRRLPDDGFQNQYTKKRRQEIAEDYPVERTRSSKSTPRLRLGSKSDANPVGRLITKTGSSSNSDAFKKFLAVGLVAAGAGVAGAVVADVATRNFIGKGMVASALEEEGDEIPQKPNFFEKIANRLETDEKAQIAVGVVGVAGLGIAGTALYVQAQRNKAIDDAKKKLDEEEKKETPPPPPDSESGEVSESGEETPKPDGRRRRKRGSEETPPPPPDSESGEVSESGEETSKPDGRRRRKRPSAQEKEVIKEAVEEIKESSALESKVQEKEKSKNKKTQGVEYDDTGLVFGEGMFEEFDDQETGTKKIRPNEKAITAANGKMVDDLYNPFYEKSLKEFRKTIDSGEFLENPFAGKNPRTAGKKILEQAVESYKKDNLDVNDPDQAKAVLARLERAVIVQNLRERALWDIKKEIRDKASEDYMSELSKISVGYGQGDIEAFSKRSKEISKSVKEQLQLAYDLVNDPDNFAAEIERRYGKEKRSDSLAYYLAA